MLHSNKEMSQDEHFWGTMLQKKIRSFRQQTRKTLQFTITSAKEHCSTTFFFISEIWWGVKDSHIVCSICSLVSSPGEAAANQKFSNIDEQSTSKNQSITH